MRIGLNLVLSVLCLALFCPAQAEAQLADGTWTVVDQGCVMIPSDFPVLVMGFNCPNNELGFSVELTAAPEHGARKELVAELVVKKGKQLAVKLSDLEGTVVGIIDVGDLPDGLALLKHFNSEGSVIFIELESAQGGMSGFSRK